ncbi:MAG: hypothetical protein NTV94_18325 [Planctomycetota bacterium]|nr:hypothetical protein [Planctomycetota bacterium]
MMNRTLCAILLAGAAVSAASATVIGISNIGGGLVMNSGPVGAGAFGNAQTDWSSVSLASVNATLNASGVATNGRITFVAADTDHGLAFMTLIDEELVGGLGSAGNVHLDTVGNDTSSAFFNTLGTGFAVAPMGTDSRIATGDLQWNSNGGGSGFAWADLVNGNTQSFRFTFVNGTILGLNDIATFQFATWTGTTWSVISVPDALLSFSATGDYGFAANVVPAPSVILAAGIPALAASTLRRRRTR